MMQINSL